jgi:hypothetical protein
LLIRAQANENDKPGRPHEATKGGIPNSSYDYWITTVKATGKCRTGKKIYANEGKAYHKEALLADYFQMSCPTNLNPRFSLLFDSLSRYFFRETAQYVARTLGGLKGSPLGYA